jgi:hypothetical protein
MKMNVRKFIAIIIAITVVITSFATISLFAGTSTPVLKQGSKGQYVKILQTKLNAVGYSCGNVDGDFGPKTYNALIAYQESRGLQVDGICGPQTWGALNSGMGPKPEPPKPSYEGVTKIDVSWNSVTVWLDRSDAKAVAIGGGTTLIMLIGLIPGLNAGLVASGIVAFFGFKMSEVKGAPIIMQFPLGGQPLIAYQLPNGQHTAWQNLYKNPL